MFSPTQHMELARQSVRDRLDDAEVRRRVRFAKLARAVEKCDKAAHRARLRLAEVLAPS